jgi:hypothetical protein
VCVIVVARRGSQLKIKKEHAPFERGLHESTITDFIAGIIPAACRNLLYLNIYFDLGIKRGNVYLLLYIHYFMIGP